MFVKYVLDLVKRSKSFYIEIKKDVYKNLNSKLVFGQIKKVFIKLISSFKNLKNLNSKLVFGQIKKVFIKLISSFKNLKTKFIDLNKWLIETSKQLKINKYVFGSIFVFGLAFWVTAFLIISSLALINIYLVKPAFYVFLKTIKLLGFNPFKAKTLLANKQVRLFVFFNLSVLSVSFYYLIITLITY